MVSSAYWWSGSWWWLVWVHVYVGGLEVGARVISSMITILIGLKFRMIRCDQCGYHTRNYAPFDYKPPPLTICINLLQIEVYLSPIYAPLVGANFSKWVQIFQKNSFWGKPILGVQIKCGSSIVHYCLSNYLLWGHRVAVSMTLRQDGRTFVVKCEILERALTPLWQTW